MKPGCRVLQEITVLKNICASIVSANDKPATTQKLQLPNDNEKKKKKKEEEEIYLQSLFRRHENKDEARNRESCCKILAEIRLVLTVQASVTFLHFSRSFVCPKRVL